MKKLSNGLSYIFKGISGGLLLLACLLWSMALLMWIPFTLILVITSHALNGTPRVTWMDIDDDWKNGMESFFPLMRRFL